MKPQSNANMDPEILDPSPDLHPIKRDEVALTTDRVVLGLDSPDSHLELVRSVAHHNMDQAFEMFTPLELLACYPDDRLDLWKDEALKSAKSLHHLFMSLPGSWPSRETLVPDWVIDSIRNRGARFSYASTGFVPGWYLAVESDEELNAVNRASYALPFYVKTPQSHLLELGFKLDFSNGDFSHIHYTYNLTDRASLTALRAMLSIGIVRIDIYRKLRSSLIDFVFAFGARLPQELIDRCIKLIDDSSARSPQLNISELQPPTSANYLDQMNLIEYNLFEYLNVCQRERRRDSTSPLTKDFERFLTVLHQRALEVHRGGIEDSSLYVEAHENLRRSITTTGGSGKPRLDVAILGAHRAYVQFFTFNGYLNCLIAYESPDTGVRCYPLEFSSDIDLSLVPESVDALVKHYTHGLQELTILLREGVKGLVISSGPDVYNVPFHEALLDLGFAEVSYTHRLSSLSEPRAVNTDETALLVGYSDPTGEHIQTVDTEVAVVANLYSVRPADLSLAEPLPEIVHLAGHGRSGTAASEVGMLLGPTQTDYLTPYKVLLEADCASTRLVFLSACSTGRGLYGQNQLVETVPMDIAFIEAGAQVVVSTSAPINDVVAGFFSSVFHFALKNGHSAWDAYTLARKSAARGDLHPSVCELAGILDAAWPTWSTEVSRSLVVAPDDWKLFRVSGRHWR
ncbi:CHAT domain-containing protein [Arthrobacter sp. 2MCAF14]